MKATIERATLLRCLSHVQSVVERRNTIPILANVLIEAEDEGVRFRATDLDIEVVDRAPARVDQKGATITPGNDPGAAWTARGEHRFLPPAAAAVTTDAMGIG